MGNNTGGALALILLGIVGILAISIGIILARRAIQSRRQRAKRARITADVAAQWRQAHEKYWRVNPAAFTVEWASNPDEKPRSWEFKMPSFSVVMRASDAANLSEMIERQRSIDMYRQAYDEELRKAAAAYDRRIEERAAAFSDEWLNSLLRGMSSDPVQRKISYAAEQGIISATQADGLREIRIHDDVDFDYLITPPEEWQPKEGTE